MSRPAVTPVQTITWITGAGSGIGRALALALLAKGEWVIGSGRSQDKLASLAAEAESLPGRFTSLPCDVSDDSAMSDLFRGMQPEITHLDRVIACAGTCEYVDFPNLETAMVRRVAEVNYFGMVNTCVAALPLLEKARQHQPGRRPHLIGVGSMSSYVGFPRAEAYGASKAAMSYFLHSLRTDLQHWLDVTVVYPGFVETPMTAANDFPMPDLVDAEEAARQILKRVPSRPREIAFPWRLNLVLKLAARLPGLWYGRIAPKLRRQQQEKHS